MTSTGQSVILDTDGSALSYQINGGSIRTVNANVLIDDRPSAFAMTGPNDGILTFTSAPQVFAGQTLTLLPTTINFNGSSTFTFPASLSVETVFLADYLNVQISNKVNLSPPPSVPEPSTAVLLAGLGAVAFVGRRRLRGA